MILHVDDHKDLMTPRLTFKGNALQDAISGAVFDIYEPDSVRSAILNGAVGVGSFMSPFIHSIPCVHLRHLSQTAPAEAPQDFTLVANSLADTILDIGASRPAVDITREIFHAPDEPRRQTPKQYRLTASLKLGWAICQKYRFCSTSIWIISTIATMAIPSGRREGGDTTRNSTKSRSR